MPSLEDFIEILLQATMITPDLNFQNGRVLRLILTDFPVHFSNVVFASDFPPGIPGEVPRVIVQSADSRLKVSAGPARVDIVWQSQKKGDRIDVEQHLNLCCDVFSRYIEEFLATIGRVGCVISRTAEDPDPAASLSRHFCKERWLQDGAAIERAADFALDAAKHYTLKNALNVNSWVKCRSVNVMRPGTSESERAILVEQDINTRDEPSIARCTIEQLTEFFALVPGEFDQIMRLYFPVEVGG